MSNAGTGEPQGDRGPWAANRQLALTGIKGNRLGVKFDGKDAAPYHSWKAALELEVTGLDLTSAEWLELVTLRTTGDALDVV